ncbi:hypothetical protein AAVH_40608 [Aphelenchoides avenae]|nr:hypothetical protein AAVH_40608 [Aphelenchus avenae]
MDALPAEALRELEELRTAVHDCLCRAGRALSRTEIVEQLKSVYRLDAESITENEALCSAGVRSFDWLLQHPLMASHVRHDSEHSYVGVPTEATRDAFREREMRERRKTWKAKWFPTSRPTPLSARIPKIIQASLSGL